MFKLSKIQTRSTRIKPIDLIPNDHSLEHIVNEGYFRREVDDIRRRLVSELQLLCILAGNDSIRYRFICYSIREVKFLTTLGTSRI